METTNRELMGQAEAIELPQRVVVDRDSTEIPVWSFAALLKKGKNWILAPKRWPKAEKLGGKMAEFFVRQRTLDDLRRGRGGKVIELDVDLLDKGGHFVILYFPNKSTLTFSIATLLDAIEEEKQAVGHQQSAKQIEARESGGRNGQETLS